MAKRPPCTRRNICSFLFFTLFLTDFVFAQLSQNDCEGGIAVDYSGLYSGIKNEPSDDSMKWCPWWAAVCGFVYRNCRPAVSCDFTNYDSKITIQYDPSLTTSLYYFQNCSSCNVQASLTNLPYGVMVPTQNPPTEMLAPGEPVNDMNTEKPAVSAASSSLTIALIAGGFIGTIIAAWTNRGASVFENAAYSAVAAAGGIPIVAASLKEAILNSEPFVDAVTLLMQFQYISLTGLLSLAYPALYRFFSFNFAWANLIIPSAELKAAAERLASHTQCLHDLGSLNPGSKGYSEMSGMDGAELRYGVDRATLGGVVYISIIIGLAVGAAIFVVASLSFRFLNLFIKSRRLTNQIEMWPAQVSNIGLRLINWALASVATFAFYQFVQPCSSRDLVAFGAVEFIFFVLILLIVTVLIVRTANREGPEALYSPSKSEESKYSRKWGSLYSKLKPALYWFFILDYIFVLMRSIIIGAGQRSGVAQVGALIALELITFIALLVKRPYKTFPSNFFHIFSAARRVFASAALIVFWDGFHILTDIKRIIGIVLMIVESVYSAALFVILVFNFGAAIFKWFVQRKERKTAPISRHTDSYSSHQGAPEK